jgi:hypothetical protein
MPYKTLSMESQAPLNQPLNPEDFELPSDEATSLSPRKKPAGKPIVKTDTARPQKKPVVVPGLGNVTLVIH